MPTTDPVLSDLDGLMVSWDDKIDDLTDEREKLREKANNLRDDAADADDEAEEKERMIATLRLGYKELETLIDSWKEKSNLVTPVGR